MRVPIKRRVALPFNPFQKSSGTVLLVRLRSLGDTVLMTPGAAVVQRVPGWKASVVVESPFDQILLGHPGIDQLFVLPGRGFSWWSRMRLIARLRRLRFDLAVDLHGGSTSALITGLSGAALRVGYAGNRHDRCYDFLVRDSRLLWEKADVHTVEHQLSPLLELGFPVEPTPAPHVPIDAMALEEVRCDLQRRGVQPGFLLVHPAAAFHTKQWEVAHFGRLLEELAPDVPSIVATCGPGQESLLEDLDRSCRTSLHRIAPLPIRRFTALASLCGLYIGNDTGPTHIAAALGKKIVVIFGSSDYRVWYPWRTEHRLVRSDLPCIPCPGYSCHLYDQPRCIRSVSVREVLKAARELL